MQEVTTRRYLAADGSWTENCQRAKTFAHTYLALLEGMDHSEKTIQVVWCFRNPDLNMYLTVKPGDEALTRPCLACPLAAAEQAA